jgi:hypothetical protein
MNEVWWWVHANVEQLILVFALVGAAAVILSAVFS